MYQFVYLLRALAAALITNAHYEDIYPLSILANGGLLGDVLFFGVSGFLLCPVKGTFPRWYIHRLGRIYPAVWIITLVYLFLGFYRVSGAMGLVRLLIYPTYYHFIASIVVLYVPFYIVMRLTERLGDRAVGWAAIVTAGAYLLYYCKFFDYSYYHIDDVYAPMIRFLFFGAMLIGARYRLGFQQAKARRDLLQPLLLAIILLAYLASKLLFASGRFAPALQPVNQVVLLAVLYLSFACALRLEDWIPRLPMPFQKGIRWLSEHTLEIYLVQYALIPRVNVGPFPLNFLAVSAAILLSAAILHWGVERLRGLAKKTARP